MRFKVEIIRRNFRSGNPFQSTRIDGTSEATIRRWEMDCKNEDEVRSFFAKAKAEGNANVAGFELHSITPLVTKQVSLPNNKEK